jgi:predicted nucleic acid-binding protein
MRVLLDTNVILDVAQERTPFNASATRILRASDFERTHLFVTASSATDIYYILRKSAGRETAFVFLMDLFKVVDVCPVDKNILLEALASNFPDFEDAVQNAAAIETRVEIIVTRNKADYATSSLTVLTPDEFASAHLA